MKTSNIKTLIVGVDLSDYSKVVVKEAKQLSKKLSIPAIYVYVFQDIYLFDAARVQVVDSYQKEVRKTYSLKPQDKVIVRFGKPHEEVLEAAKSVKSPLIVIGHRGHSVLSRFFIGSTAERLSLLSPYPVWIHRGQKVAVPKRILLPCDLSSRSHHTLKKFSPLQKTFKAAVEVHHVFQEPMPILDYQIYYLVYEQLRKNDEQMLRSFKKKHPTAKTTVSSGANVAQKIQEKAKKFDLIALSPRSHKGHSAFGSTTTKLVRSGDRPILIIP